jgi:hypothetical protein
VVRHPSRRRLFGLFFSCVYLVFLSYMVIGELQTRDSRLEQVITLSTLAVFVVGYVTYWWTSMTDEGWTCPASRLRTAVGVGLCAIALGLTLLDFQIFGGLLIFACPVLAGMLPGRPAALAVFAVSAVELGFIHQAGLDLITYSYLVLVSLLSGFSVIFGRRMSQYGSDLRSAREEIASPATSTTSLATASPWSC